jgi:hypothetical protein
VLDATAGTICSISQSFRDENVIRAAAFGAFDNSLPKGNFLHMRHENACLFLTPGTLLAGY